MWKQETLPHRLRSKLLTAFAHEVDFRDLVFSRSCFWKQFTTLQFAVKVLMTCMGVSLEVPSLPIIPHFKNATFAPPTGAQ